ncbi:MAG: FecR family protein [Patescibacteria group bacterium]
MSIKAEKQSNGTNAGFEATLWAAADKMRGSVAWFLLLAVFCSGILLSWPDQARAESGSETKDRWVFRKTTERKDLCEAGPSCLNPQVNLDQSGAIITWGADLGDCDGAYQAVGTWTTPPETLIPGQSVSTSLEASLKQTTACAAALDADNFVSLMVGKMVPPDIYDVGKWEQMGFATVHQLLQQGKEFSDSKTVDWAVPQGNTGEELRLRLGAGTGSLPGGYIVFIYDYQTDAITATDAPAAAETETADDVCAINTTRTSWRFPSLISSAYARDSGARFADFSGEVTVAPGNDPADLRPAEMDMVLETGSIIKTESDSTAIISFADMTTFCMKPFTTVILDTPPEQDSKLSLLAGKVWMNVKKMVKDGTMNVTMNQAVAGIKGTVFILEDDGDTSAIKVVEGNVEYTSLANDVMLPVAGGETVVASADGLTPKADFDIATERAQWQEFASPQPGNTVSEDTDSNFSYAYWSAILVVVIGGGWVVMKKLKHKQAQ